ncbi:hypothetical protein GQ42DRAFT_164551, partial [Ramicandelaber brevisporus]
MSKYILEKQRIYQTNTHLPTWKRAGSLGAIGVYGTGAAVVVGVLFSLYSAARMVKGTAPL